MNDRLRQTLFVLCLALCAFPWVSTAVALVMGVAFSFLIGNPWPYKSAKVSKVILQVSVVGLGFGLSLGEVLHTGRSSLLYTVVGIIFTLSVGYLLGTLFKTDKNTSLLISFGTAICGGSAIAAMAPVLKAKDDETAVALATVFTLNSVALLLFPLVGHILNLSQGTFGTWAGLAIHDTSSVVGAASAYGASALAVGTTVKLTRTIWITPVVIGTAWLKKSERKAGIPLFIIGFVLAATIRTLLPQYDFYWGGLASVAKQCLVGTLFLVGAGLSREVLKKVGVRPLLQGVTLWLLVSVLTLAALMLFGIA
ncbi:MAG: putative sulfate exporter family transporter [Geobacter sp.]|nr:MAG: putative sulfate exporter family transporter [Geobacter sp.]